MALDAWMYFQLDAEVEPTIAICVDHEERLAGIIAFQHGCQHAGTAC